MVAAPSEVGFPCPPADVYVVVPCYNEGPVIAEVLAGLCAHFPNVVAVDDGSTDATWERLRESRATVLRHVVNLGQGAALQTGLTYALRAGAKYLVTFDADGQHQVEDLARLLTPVVAGQADVALGSRFLGAAVDMPLGKRLVLRAAVTFTRVAGGIRLTDTHNGLRALTAEAARKLPITQNRMAHASELLHNIVERELRYVEVPVTIRYTEWSRAKGQSVFNAVNILFDLAVRRLLST
jgi:glycosyltransferase involved in cell wall biosynthesis